jgi:hypothetical protein
MTANTPLEARCDHCKQTRPLFLYEPDHTMHWVPVSCRWCDREKQPLLCVRCWGKERELEENTPATPEEEAAGAFLGQMLAANRRYADQSAADRAACDGIAAATKRAEAES